MSIAPRMTIQHIVLESFKLLIDLGSESTLFLDNVTQDVRVP